MYYGLKKAFPTLTVVSEERGPQDSDVPLPVLDSKVTKSTVGSKRIVLFKLSASLLKNAKVIRYFIIYVPT